LIIYQVKGAWQIKYKELKPYHEYLSKLIEGFEEIEFTHLGRDKNQFFDALATLASMTQIDYEDPVKNSPVYYCSIGEETDKKPWITI